jgi:proteic killer suppression protein
MDILFADATLALIETEDAGQTKLPVPVIKSARRKLTSLRNWKSLHYERLRGDRAGLRSIRLNDQYRMVFELDESTGPQTVTIMAIEDYH